MTDRIRIRRAREMRVNGTDAERAMWRIVRSRRLAGLKFRRQRAVGPFIVDFVSLSERLIVEVDGGQHGWRADEDASRTCWLEARGYRVLRVWNGDVLANPEGIAEAILGAVGRGWG